MKTTIVIDSRREIGARGECETRLYLTSSALTAAEFDPMVRDHCNVETACIGCMDMTFRDDKNRVRTNQASELLFVPSKFTRMDLLFTGDKTRAVGVWCRWGLVLKM
tara:strand:- start:2170 stop:2490 length:321 start_codon:yes stop_codon:yes gene_type:complete